MPSAASSPADPAEPPNPPVSPVYSDPADPTAPGFGPFQLGEIDGRIIESGCRPISPQHRVKLESIDLGWIAEELILDERLNVVFPNLAQTFFHRAPSA